MSKSPLITVIVPIYKVEKYLIKCIDSIIDQTYLNLEIILIDDGSPDRCPQICDEYANLDKRIKVIHQSNKGVSSARNAGISIANGDYIGFVDGDDYIEREMYEEMLAKILLENAQICVCTKCIVNGEYKSYSDLETDYILQFEAIKQLSKLNFPTSLWACLYLKDVSKTVYLNEDIHFWEDFEYQFRVLLQSNRIAICNNSWYHYRQRVDSASKQQINEKVMSCLKIAPRIKDIVRGREAEWADIVNDIDILFLMQVIFRLVSSENVANKYYRIISLKSRRCLFKMLKSKTKNLYKLAILVSSVNSLILCRMYKIWSYINSFYVNK